MITARTLGIATIGQTPREDIAARCAEQAPSSTRVLLRGCLDNLTDEQIAQRPPMDDADTLYTQLRDKWVMLLGRKISLSVTSTQSSTQVHVPHAF